MEYNIGNAFDEIKGTFTCPFDGIYSFFATAGINGNRYGSIYIRVNGESKIEHHIRHGTSDFDHSTPTGAFKLKKGDNVTIHMSGTFNYANSQCYRTYFHGHLIAAL